MREGAYTVLGAAARFYMPLIVLFGFVLLATRPAGAGVGFSAGLAVLLAVAAHALVFGANAARAATPPWPMRVLAALGLGAAAIGTAATDLPFARQLAEGGLFTVTAAGGALIVTALFGRAPTMRDQTP